MARDVIDQSRIPSHHMLIATLEKSCKPREAFRIGTEYESFVFDKKTHKPAAYEGPRGIGVILEKLCALSGWKRIEDQGVLIGLLHPKGQGAISLEPGGQLELSGAAFETLHETHEEIESFFAHLREIMTPLDLGLLGMGMAPTWRREDMPHMPKSRYAIMTRYMPTVGPCGLDMMYRTASVQVNLDFASEADMILKMRVGLALQPIVSGLFANSPLTESALNGFHARRGYIWQHTDSQRCGFLPFVFDEGFGFESYVQWALDVPMYFVKRGTVYHDATHVTFRQFMNGALKEDFHDAQATLGDWYNHLSTLFPEVRLKPFLEMRGTDAPPFPLLGAIPALWTGLLYCPDTLMRLWESVRTWDRDERVFLQNQVPKGGLETVFRGKPLYALAQDLVALAIEGLKARRKHDTLGCDESSYLLTLQEEIARKQTPATRTIYAFKNTWRGNADCAFLENSY